MQLSHDGPSDLLPAANGLLRCAKPMAVDEKRPGARSTGPEMSCCRALTTTTMKARYAANVPEIISSCTSGGTTRGFRRPGARLWSDELGRSRSAERAPRDSMPAPRAALKTNEASQQKFK